MQPSISPSRFTFAMRYGLLTGLVSSIIFFALNVLHLVNSPAKWLYMPVLIAGIFLAQQGFKKRHTGFMSYRQGLEIGIILSAVVGVIFAVFVYVYSTFIAPIEKAESDAEFIGRAVGFVFILIMFILSGLLISLVVSAFVKKAKPEFE